MTTALTDTPKFKQFDTNGDPLVGGKLYSYESGTTTPKATYQDAGKLQENTNPVVLDSYGQAEVWLDGLYTLTMKDSNDVTLWSVDGISSGIIETGATLPSIIAGDANRYVTVKSDESGYENTTLDLSLDPTPELGGDLTLGGNSIVTDTAGNDVSPADFRWLSGITSGGYTLGSDFLGVAAIQDDISYISGATAGGFTTSTAEFAAKGNKGWATFNGNPVAERDSYNVSSITDLGVGVYQVNWDNDFANQNYAPIVSCYRNGGSTGAIANISGVSVGSVTIYIFAADGTTAIDVSVIAIKATGDM